MDTPPPYPSGKPWHPGALTQYAQIDMVARAARMRGYNVLYPVGIDRNGLPVEIATERKYRIQMRKTPREEFIGLCKHALDDIEAYMVELLKRMGISGDFKEKYRTDSEDYRTLTQWSFIELWNKGLIHIATRPNNYCTDCGTTIADAEIEYEDLPAYLVTNRFTVKETGEEILVDDDQARAAVGVPAGRGEPDDERYKRMVGKTAVVPIYGKEVPIKTHKSVDIAFGTGVLMVCSYGDYNDVQIFRQLRSPRDPGDRHGGEDDCGDGQVRRDGGQGRALADHPGPPGRQDRGQGRAGAAPDAAVREEPHAHRDHTDGGVLSQAARSSSRR